MAHFLSTYWPLLALWGWIFGWGVFRFFVPTPRQRAMIRMRDRIEGRRDVRL